MENESGWCGDSNCPGLRTGVFNCEGCISISSGGGLRDRAQGNSEQRQVRHAAKLGADSIVIHQFKNESGRRGRGNFRVANGRVAFGDEEIT